MKKYILISILLLFSIIVYGAYSIYMSDNSILINKYNIKETSEYDNIKFPTYSPDGKSFAYVAEKDGKQFVVKDGIELIKYNKMDNSSYSIDSEEFIINYLTYPKTGTGFAYVVRLINGKEFIVKDGIEGNKFDNIKFPTYSPDGKSFAYVASNDGKEFIVKDGIEGNKFDYISDLSISPDGNHIAFGTLKEFKNFIVKDNITIDKYTSSYNPVFSSNGKSFAYVASNDGKEFIVKDGIESEKYDYVYYPTYSPNGKSFMFLALENGKEFVVKDGIESEKYDLIFSPKYFFDSNNLIFVAKKDSKWFVVNNGIIESQKYTSDNVFNKNSENLKLNSSLITSVSRTLDGKSLSFVIENNGVKTVIKDNIGVNKYYYSDYPTYLGNGTSFVYVASMNSKQILVIDGIEISKYNFVYPPIYSPDGKSFSFIADYKGKKIVVAYSLK